MHERQCHNGKHNCQVEISEQNSIDFKLTSIFILYKFRGSSGRSRIRGQEEHCEIVKNVA